MGREMNSVMKCFFRVNMILISILLTSPVLAGDSLEDLLQKVKHRYRNLPGFSVAYSREILTKSMALLGDEVTSDLAEGQIFFKPPYFLKIQQERPRPETVVSDGAILWWHIPDKKQAYRYPSHKLGEELRLLVDIFYGLRQVEESFKIALMETKDEELSWIRLTPDPPWPQIKEIKLAVVKGDHRIHVVETHNLVGGITRFTLGTPVTREDLEKDFFAFSLPEGTQVIEE
jgi:outer membrane lipoprotein-sorting protein